MSRVVFGQVFSKFTHLNTFYSTPERRSIIFQKSILYRNGVASKTGTFIQNHSKYHTIDNLLTCKKSSENMSKEADRLVWVDLEMTGLDITKEHIIEMACLISDADLNIIAEGPNLIIHQPDEVLDNMNEWCKEHHGKSGLTKAVRESRITLQDAESKMLDFIGQHTPPSKCPLAGNSVHADKVFLDKFMPRFMGHLHYRIVDVSSVKELCRRWYPEASHAAPAKAGSHRALEDIRESIKELQYYRSTIFK